MEIKKREEQMNLAQYLVWVFASMVGSVKEKLHLIKQTRTILFKILQLGRGIKINSTVKKAERILRSCVS